MECFQFYMIYDPLKSILRGFAPTFNKSRSKRMRCTLDAHLRFAKVPKPPQEMPARFERSCAPFSASSVARRRRGLLPEARFGAFSEP